MSGSSKRVTISQERAASESSRREKGVQVGTYPEQKKSCMKSKKVFPKINNADGQVYLFIRAKKESIQRIKNACAKGKRVVQNHNGEFIGISDDVILLEGDLYANMPAVCILVIRFQSMFDCQRWHLSDSIFKQKDFPTPSDEMEMFAVPLQYLPEEEMKMKAFHLTEMVGLNVRPETFHEHYIKPVTELMDKREIYHGVIATKAVERIRNSMLRPDTYVLVNCAESVDKLQSFYDSCEYTPYKNHRQCKLFDKSDSCIFSLSPVFK